jgi:poly-gamma-glutamate capsule biosynthesis protein CapA/YwtB (metallophosphatase superfamily)
MFVLFLISHNAHSCLGLEWITPHYTDTFILYGMVSIIGIQSPARPARCQSLYRLSYPTHKTVAMVSYIRGEQI